MTPAVQLRTSETEGSLAKAARAFLGEHASIACAAARYDLDDGPARELWQRLVAELGVHALLLPESAGGLGLGHREVAAVATEIGRALAPVPFLTSSVVATQLALCCGDATLLDQLAAGRVAVLAVPASAGATAPVPTVSADAGTLTGSLHAVLDADLADLLLVPARDAAGGVTLYEVPAGTAGVTVETGQTLDMTRRLGEVDLARVGGARPFAHGAVAETASARARAAGCAALAAEQLGLAEWCFDEARSYLLQRRQFGRLIGSFQALKHRMADLWVTLDSLRTAARYAAAVLADGPEHEVALAASLAQATTSDAAVAVAEASLQLHGGIGMTWEHPLHLYLKRAKADQLVFGTAEQHRVAIGPLVGLDLDTART